MFGVEYLENSRLLFLLQLMTTTNAGQVLPATKQAINGTID